MPSIPQRPLPLNQVYGPLFAYVLLIAHFSHSLGLSPYLMRSIGESTGIFLREALGSDGRQGRMRMIEWRVVQYREGVASDGEQIKRSVLSAAKGPGLLNYLIGGLTVFAFAIFAVFAFGFFVVFILPVLLIGGAVFLWRWRRMMAAQQEFLKKHQGQTPKDSFFRESRDDGVIDV